MMVVHARRAAVTLCGIALTLVMGLSTRALGSEHRVLGVDVSSWQFDMNWETTYEEGIRFAFVRSSRGGTTSATGSVVDERFIENMQEIDALAQQGKTIYAGAYHYGRPDTIGSTINSATIQSHAQDQAQHFYNTAGDYMTAGYLRPVLDLEAGGDELTAEEMSLWVNSFSDYLVELSGAEPLIYLNAYYATYQVDPSVAHHDLWLARYNTPPVDPLVDNPETPPGNYPNPYGVWNDPIGSEIPSHDAWSFWQYTISDEGARYGASSERIDLDVANGDINFVRGFLIPEPTSAALAACGAVLLLRRRR